jgi:hypothetical protein
MLSLDRAEGAVIVVVGVIAALLLRKAPRMAVLCVCFVAFLAPVGWAIRNDVVVGHLELSDPLYRDQQFLLPFTDGSQSNPLFLEAGRIGARGRMNSVARTRYPHEVWEVATHTPISRAVKFDIKALANFAFVPPVWGWAIESFADDYTLGESVRHLSARNVVRIAWSACLVLLYALAGAGIVHWWRRRRHTYVVALLIYPCIEVLIAIPFQADPREWLFASLLAIIPAAQGAQMLSARLGRSVRSA